MFKLHTSVINRLYNLMLLCINYISTKPTYLYSNTKNAFLEICIINTLKFRLATLAGNKTTRPQTNSRSVKSRTGQLAEMFNLNCGVYNSSKCYFRQITLFIHCQYLIGLELGLGLGFMYK